MELEKDLFAVTISSIVTNYDYMSYVIVYQINVSMVYHNGLFEVFDIFTPISFQIDPSPIMKVEIFSSAPTLLWTPHIGVLNFSEE